MAVWSLLNWQLGCDRGCASPALALCCLGAVSNSAPLLASFCRCLPDVATDNGLVISASTGATASTPGFTSGCGLAGGLQGIGAAEPGKGTVQSVAKLSQLQ